MTKLIKYTVEHFRAEGISEQEFEKFLMEVHIPTAIALFKKYGIVKYSIVRPECGKTQMTVLSMTNS